MPLFSILFRFTLLETQQIYIQIFLYPNVNFLKINFLDTSWFSIWATCPSSQERQGKIWLKHIHSTFKRFNLIHSSFHDLRFCKKHAFDWWVTSWLVLQKISRLKTSLQGWFLKGWKHSNVDMKYNKYSIRTKRNNRSILENKSYHSCNLNK